MPKKIEEKIHILSPSRGYLAAANIMGPIVHPLIVDKSVAAKILMSGAEVYEYIPSTKNTLKLTLGNINDPNRYTALEPKVTEKPFTPVAPVTKTGVPNVTPPVVTEPEPEQKQDTEEEKDIEEPAAEEETEDTATANEEVHAVDVTVTAADETAQVSTDAFVFEYNEDGTIDETNIDWASYSKNQRKEIRAQINAHNASLQN